MKAITVRQPWAWAIARGHRGRSQARRTGAWPTSGPLPDPVAATGHLGLWNWEATAA